MENLLKQVRKAMRGKVATWVFLENATGKTTLTVVYHNTRVVEFDGEQATLNNGGYHTVTTKRRINQVLSLLGLNWFLYQENWNWYLTNGNEVIEFHNGIKVRKG